MIRGNLLQKSETAYSKAISEATALRSSQSAALHREHMRLMQELEEQALREESKSHHDFLSTCQATLHHTLQPLRESLATSYHVLLGQSSLSPPSVLPAKAPLVEEQPPTATPLTPAPKQSPRPKRQLPSPEPQGSMSIDVTAQRLCRKDHLVPKGESPLPGSLHLNLVMWRPSSRTLVSCKRPGYAVFQPFIQLCC